ncbi:hypothetical protein Tco_0169702 [Tanacetum coccineum]
MIFRYDDNDCSRDLIKMEIQKELEFLVRLPRIETVQFTNISFISSRGKIRRSFIRILPGDRVKIEMNGGGCSWSSARLLVASEFKKRGRQFAAQYRSGKLLFGQCRQVSTRFIQWKFVKGAADRIGIAMRRALLGEIEGTCITRAKFEKI